MINALVTRLVAFGSGAAVTEPAKFADIFDSSIIDALIELLKKLTHTFTIFPLNLVMISAIAGIAFGLMRKAKKTATK